MNTQNIQFPFRDKVKNLLFRKKFFLGRVACLGKDVFYLKNKSMRNINLVNMQKCRVDLFMHLDNGTLKKPDAQLIAPYILQDHIREMIKEQSDFNWQNPPAGFNYFVMDSYSELTDQLFIHKTNGQAFCANYSDIDHSGNFSEHFDSKGLMEIDDMEKNYDAFFTFITKKFPDKKIYFMHFSCVFEEREKFRQRRAAISDIMKRMPAKYPQLVNIDLDDTLFEKDEKDDFPYHYNVNTYEKHVNAWNKKLTS